MVKNSQNLGFEGEEIARKYLLKNGYEILETNWRFKKLEIDIISKKNDLIVFVEVKARSSDVFGDPEVFVTKSKQRFLVAAAHQYLTERNIALETRFDVISVLHKNGQCQVNQLEGAFYAMG
jgi:putative endonuclease